MLAPMIRRLADARTSQIGSTAPMVGAAGQLQRVVSQPVHAAIADHVVVRARTSRLARIRRAHVRGIETVV